MYDTLMVMVILLGGALYFAPVFVASYREHINTGAIFILNLLLGWTVLGWIVAMVWAWTANTNSATPTNRGEPRDSHH